MQLRLETTELNYLISDVSLSQSRDGYENPILPKLLIVYAKVLFEQLRKAQSILPTLASSGWYRAEFSIYFLHFCLKKEKRKSLIL